MNKLSSLERIQIAKFKTKKKQKTTQMKVRFKKKIPPQTHCKKENSKKKSSTELEMKWNFCVLATKSFLVSFGRLPLVLRFLFHNTLYPFRFAALKYNQNLCRKKTGKVCTHVVHWAICDDDDIYGSVAVSIFIEVFFFVRVSCFFFLFFWFMNGNRVVWRENLSTSHVFRIYGCVLWFNSLIFGFIRNL